MVDLVPETVIIQTFYIMRKKTDINCYQKFYVPGIKACISRDDDDENYNKVVTRSSFVIPEDHCTFQTDKCSCTPNTPLLSIAYNCYASTSYNNTLFFENDINFDTFISVSCIMIRVEMASNFNITALKLYDEDQYITCRKITRKKHPVSPHYKIYIIDLSNIEINDYLSTTIEFVGSNIPKSFAYSVYYLRTSQPEPKQIY